MTNWLFFPLFFPPKKRREEEKEKEVAKPVLTSFSVFLKIFTLKIRGCNCMYKELQIISVGSWLTPACPSLKLLMIGVLDI